MDGAGRASLEGDPGAVLADPVNVLIIVADTEDTRPDDVQPENQDIKQLRELYDLMQEEGLENLELQDPDFKIRLQRATHRHGAHDLAHRTHPPSASSSSSKNTDPEVLPNVQTITAPLAGVFYRASSPTSAPYVQEGSIVDSGQTLCIVEAMKVMNEIKSESRCRVVKILAENSRPVTAGQVLFHVEPA
jgi:acetyl-CoA carboxylase biotin carboxyl carrier protein